MNSTPDPFPKPENRPGLSQIAYRIADYRGFLNRLLSQLPAREGGLQKLTTRLNDDAAIALLDAWAVVADVLTFYQERIANEGYLRTATERFSVLELARAIGYELNPGVAASTFLTFSVEDTPGSPRVATIPKGTQIMSIPSKDELPQTFETSENFTAYADWNTLTPRSTRPQKITSNTRQLYLNSISTLLQAGDFLLLIDEDREIHTYLLPLTEVVQNSQAGYTLVQWEESLPAIDTPLRNPKVFAFRQRANLFGHNAPDWEQMPAEIKLAAIADKGKLDLLQGGIFHTENHGDTWNAVSKGLPNADILCLIIRDGVLFAGTAGKGIFRSKDNGSNWEPVNNGLTNLNIQALYTAPDGRSPLFAGTPGGGVFRSKDRGENWVPINTGNVRVEGQGSTNWQSINTSLPNSVVRSILSYTTTTQDLVGTGTISSEGNRVSGYATEFTRELQVGHNITVLLDGGSQTKQVTQIDYDTSLLVDSPFISQGLNPGTAFVATTFVVSQPNEPINSIVVDQGTISSSGTEVTGVGTEFSRLRNGNTSITITALGQTKTVVNIISDTSLTIDSPFTKNSLNPGTTFLLSTPVDRNYLFVGTDDGLYRSQNQGDDWTASNLTDKVVHSLLYQGTSIFAGTDKGLYRSLNQGQSWSLIIDDNNNPSLNSLAVYALSANDGLIFAGTEAGVIYYSNQGENWQAINTRQDDSNNPLGNYKIRSLATYQQDEILYLFAASEQGIFRSTYRENSNSTDNFQWALASQSLPTQDMTALTCNEVQKTLFAGSKFAGFLQSGVDNQSQAEGNNTTNQTTNKQEWPDFKLQSNQIDLDSLYPQILPKTWIVLLDKDNSINQENNQLNFAIRQVKSTSTITRTDFGLTAKITQIEPDKALDNADNFKLRSTVFLNRSEELELAKERLTVSDRQQEIFQDPIQGNTVFLSQFVQGLQPNQTLIVSGKHLRVQLNDIGGVYRLTRSHATKLGSIQWQKVKEIFWKYVFLVNPPLIVLLALSQKYFEMHPRINRGLTNSQVRSLASNAQGNVIWAGTTEGIFRSLDNGEYWEPIDSWEDINKTLNKKEIQALLSKPSIEANSELIFVGTAEGIFRSNDGGNQWVKINQRQGLTYTDIRAIAFNAKRNTLFVGTINGGVFQSQNKGENWKATRLIGTDVQALAVKQDSSDELIAGTVRDGVFYSPDDGSTWQQITEIRQGRGTISSDGNQVTWMGSNFNQQLQAGDIINAADQSRTVIDVVNNNSSPVTFTVDEPFRPDLLPETAFTINTGLTNRNITAVAIAENYLFAGTAGSGVFRAKDNGDRWEQVNTNLTDLEIRCLTVDADGRLWVGTSKGGVFYSNNQGELWAPANTNLTNIDVRAILIPQDSQNIFVGGIGILLSPDGFETKPVQRRDVVQLLELPTLLPNTLIPYQQWKVMDKDGFQGNLTTTQYDSVGVESSDNEDDVSPQLTLLPAAAESELVSEVANIQLPPTEQQLPILTLQQPLKYSYDPATVQVFANVVQATHGQTIEEVLGSGDGYQTNQRFALKKPPLTYVPTTTASGAKSTLEVRVNGVLWQEVPSLYPLTPQDQNYIIRIEDDGTTTVTFGDGIKGARLPSGNENLTATYRSGIGLDGNIAATRLSLLKTRPQGIVEVNNPIPATGAAPPESLEEAREKAPPTVRTLDRIVSLRDFEDFARGFAGIGKAQAVALWHEENHLVHITIAAVGGDSVLPESSLYTNLVEAIKQARDPLQQVQVDSYDRILFNLEARLLINPRYQPEAVEQKVLTALKTTFAFPRRQFGQNVTAAEAIATMQNVEGVIAVDLDALYPSGRSKALDQSLPAFQARSDTQTNQVYPAQLLLLNPAGIKLAIVSTL